MLFYPCLALMVLTFVYMTTGFALFHYYRDPKWIPDQATNTTDLTDPDLTDLTTDSVGDDGEVRHCPRTF